MKAKVTRGAHIPVALNYVADARASAAGTSAKRPELIATNLACTVLDPRAMAAEFAAVRRLRPEVQKPAWHCSLSLPQGERLSSERWTELVDKFLDKMMFDVALTQFVCVRHNDKPKGDHVHIVCNRIGLDGKIWHGQWEARKAIQATQELERDFGLQLTPGLHGDDDAAAAAKAKRPDRQADSQSVINANRVKGQPRIDTTETARILRDCASRSHDLPTFVALATEAGIKVLPNRSKTTGRMSGLSVIPRGRKKAIKLSDATKNKLSWPKLLKTWAQNDAVADAARTAAADAIAVATARAAQQAEARLARQPAPEIPQARALSPEAIETMKEKIMSDETDPLHFLSTPPPPRPHGQALDDADLAPATTGSPSEPPAETDEDDRARHERIELEQAEIELDKSFRRMTFDELLDIKNAKLPPLLITAAQWQALLNLIAKILSLGLISGSNSFAESISAKESLAARAAVEIARRKRTPNGVQEKMKVLTEFEKAVKSRALELQKRASIRASIRQQSQSRGPVPGVHTRAELEAGFDRLQVHLHKPTLGALKLALDKAEAAVARRQARVDADTELAGMFGLRVKRGTATQAQAAARAAALAAARRARAAAQRAWDEATETIVAEQGRERAAAAEAQSEQAEAEQQEREVLGLELGEGQPGGLSPARRQLDAEALREQVRGVAHGVSEGQGDTDAERAAAREEWLALIRKGG